MAKRKCRYCGERKDRDSMVITPLHAFCDHDHLFQYANAIKRQAYEKQLQKQQREFKAETKRMRDSTEARRTELLDNLQALVNQWIVHVRDKDKPCCTCGTTNPNIKYDAGHWQTRGARAELRFNLYNINKQCSQKCNVFASGAKQEHEQFIRETHGGHIADWLISRTHPSLKELYPDSEAIKADLKRWRKILRNAGLKPYK
jgi:hypothetical protein